MSRTPSAILTLDHGFYGKAIMGCVGIRAHATVSDAALHEAERKVQVLLAGCEQVRANLASAGAELHIIGCEQQVTDLPMYQHMAGVPFEGDLTMDERGRGYGGLHACCAEESLLKLSSARHRDHRDVTSHELAHTVLSYGLDTPLRATWEARFHAAMAEGMWGSAYATTNAHEFFAELTMWYVGSRGDFGDIHPRPAEGRTWLAQHDPISFALMHAIYTGALRPQPLAWERLQPTHATRSLNGDTSTVLMVCNTTAAPLDVVWLSYTGERSSFGRVQPGGVHAQDTYASHPWILVGPDEEHGPFVPTAKPGRVTI